ncbi:MAG: chromosomal replication initiator protein DnaA [Candidatus Taylorbacteria bacterium]|nr:chromosomal replication initiator protein DnaA [Candidatus Taylorbacteria bacterium]
MDNKKLWDSVLVEVELNVSKANFGMWFKDTYILKQEEGMVFLSVPNIFVKDWLLNKFHKFILKSLRNYSGDVRALEYVVAKDSKKREADSRMAEPEPIRELPLPDVYINKEDNLNPRYTFESFIVGPFNELAYAAAQAIIKKPLSYNPLFVYGGTGHGKTHLIQAVGNQLKAGSRERKIYYITSEKFAVDFFNSLQSGKVNNFKEKYRKYDVLIMDDVQFFSSKERSQEELFHLFNTLYDNNKQLVFSSDKHPNFIPSLEERLKSRFVAGMIVDIPPPDYESRLAIIQVKIKLHNSTLSSEVIKFLAENIDSNIRELEGILNSIICQTQLKNRELSIMEIKNLIKISRPKKTVSVKDVIKIISGFYNIDEASIYEKTRRKEVVKPRQMIMYILREDFNVSYPSIGAKLGGRDHTTVIHSCEKIKEDLKTDSILTEELNQIRNMIV